MYDLLLNQDETLIVATAREFLGAKLPIERLRPGAKVLDDDAVWQGIAELGWLGAGLPESAGGSGFGLVAEMLIQRECGRNLVSPRVLATMLASHVAHCAGDAALAASFANGASSAALGIAVSPLGPDAAMDVLGCDWDGPHKLVCWNQGGMGLLSPSGMEAVNCIDESVTLHSGRIEPGCAKLWDIATPARLPQRADILVAAALVGLADRACELATEYAKTREQFGQAIGSFQAIKHRLADMAVRQRLAWYQCCLAALKFEANAPDTALQVASARLLAADAAHENGRACIQIHGGIGFQAECDAHWFVKRAAIYDQAGGALAVQATRIIAQPCPEW